MQIERLQTEIEMLSTEDFGQLRRWFADKDWQRWDQQLETDVESGKLDFLFDEAAAVKQQGALREL